MTDRAWEHWAVLALIVGICLSQGLFRVFAVPPWSNFDEPGHMEYVLYVTEHHALPRRDSFDLPLRQRIADVSTHNDCSRDKPGSDLGCLRFQQLSEAPAFYIIQAAVQSLVPGLAIIQRLYIARIVSVLLATATVVIGYGTARLAIPARPSMAALVAGVMAVWPGYVNIGAAVNNDVMAALSGTGLLYAGVYLVNKGLGWRSLGQLAVAMMLCAASKVTALTLIPVGLVAVLLALTSIRTTALLTIACLAVSAFLSLELRGSADWIKPKYLSVDRLATDAKYGSYVLQVYDGGTLRQVIAPSETAGLRGQWVTVGAWMRSEGDAVSAPLPRLNDGRRLYETGDTQLGRQWQFFSSAVEVDSSAPNLAVELSAPQGVAIEYDGVVLAAGQFGQNPPDWEDSDLTRGAWRGRAFTNLMWNASGERGWLLLHDSLDSRLPFSVNQRLEALYSWRFSRDYYLGALEDFGIGFWGDFAGGTASFRWPFTLALLGLTVLIAVGLLGLALALFQGRLKLSPSEARCLVLSLCALALTAVALILRANAPPLDGSLNFLPSMRYAFGALAPIAGALLAGVLAWLPRARRRAGGAAFIAFLYVAHVLSVLFVQLPVFRRLWTKW